MFNQPIPVGAAADVGTLDRAATQAVRLRPERSHRSATRPRRESVASSKPRRTDRARKSSRIVNLLAVVVAAMFVASMIGLAVFVPSNGNPTLSGPAVISGAAGTLSAVAGLVVGYLKAVQLAARDS